MVKSFILSNCSFERFTVTVFLCHRCNIVIYLSIYIYMHITVISLVEIYF